MYKILLILLLYIAFVFPPCMVTAYNPQPRPKFNIVLSSPTAGDDFLFAKLTENIIITKIEGILQSGTSVTGLVQVCNSVGEACINVRGTMTFDGGLDEYTDMVNSTAVSGNTLRWETSTVSSPGFLLIIIHYRVRP